MVNRSSYRLKARKKDMQEKDVQQESQVMSGPGQSSHTPSKSVSPWSGRLRQGNGSPGSVESQVTTGQGKEKVAQPMTGFDTGNSSNDESLIKAWLKSLVYQS